MKNKNSGMSIVEILVSISIISIVLILLFSLLTEVEHEDSANNVHSNFIINQSSFTKMIEEDILDYGVKAVSNCTFEDVNIGSETVNTGYEDNFKCVRLDFDDDALDANIGFIVIYNYYTKYSIINGKYQGTNPSWMITYTRGKYEKYNQTTGLPIKSSWKSSVSMMKEIPSEVDLDDITYVMYTAAAGTSLNAASVVIPIKDLQNEHYDINLSFIFKGNDNFKCLNQNSNFSCVCKSSTALCNNTYN